ncbi:MAG: methyltransferase domain-containing protein [Planctomycetota bacterium]|nr:methyltransferase domain-containing protein [Planctomycetota bacterium]
MTVEESQKKRRFGRTLRELFQIAGLFLVPSRNRSNSLYSMLSTHNNLAEKSLYLNLGFWETATSYDEACQALAEKLGDLAGIAKDDLVLDCGFGFGDQDALWLKRHEPAKISALNITGSQVTLAKERFPDPRLDFIEGSATTLAFANDHFDKVLALESAFHFKTRDDFLKEALRVLKPGGCLAMADIVQARAPANLSERLAEYGGRALWQIPSGNLCEIPEYRKRLEQAGFVKISIEAIGDKVYKPFENFAQSRLHDPEVVARLNPLIRKMWSIPNSGALALEYVMVRAEKPS